MTQPHDYEPLPERLEQSLQALGDALAPAELADRVALACFDVVNAPGELRDRVNLARLGRAGAPDELWVRVEPAVKAEARPILFLRRIGRISAAAAIMLAVLIGLNMASGPEELTELDYTAYVDKREQVRSEYLLIKVKPEELSGTARGLAVGLGGDLQQGGAL